MNVDVKDLYDDANAAYFNGSLPKFGTRSSSLVSASKYLNSPVLRDLAAQELLRRNGPDITPTAFIAESARALTELEDWEKIGKLFEAEKARLPHFREFCEQRRLAPCRPEDLVDPKPGTLRELIHDFVVNSGYQMDIFKHGREAESEIEFVMKHRGISHDIEHLLTGFETNSGGEVALAAANTRAMYRYFVPELAAFFERLVSFLSAAKIVRSNLYYPAAVPGHLEAEDWGAAQGKDWKMPLILLPYHDLLDWQVADIREEYGITNVPPKGIWQWTEGAYEDARISDEEIGTAPDVVRA